MIPEQQHKELEAWQNSARYWDKYRGVIAEMFAPVTSALIDQARIRRGDKVLDLGGGSGEPSLTISGIVGLAGSVTYTDPVAAMVETARSEAGVRGLTNIYFRQCSADALPFPDRAFDVAVGRFSAMFFPDPGAAVREALRVIRVDGCLSLVVWGSEEANPFFSTVNRVVDELMQSPPDDPNSPDAFRFAVPGKLVAILESAGAEAVSERRLDFEIKAPLSFEEYWQLRTEMSESLRNKMARLTPAELPAIKQAVGDAARQYFENGGMNFPAEALIVSGRAG